MEQHAAYVASVFTIALFMVTVTLYVFQYVPGAVVVLFYHMATVSVKYSETVHLQRKTIH